MGAFFRNLAGRGSDSTHRIPRGYRVYAVGDVHGRLDLLDEMLLFIEGDIGKRREAQNIIVFLGDLIDRGPDSRGVIERVCRYQSGGVRVVALIGNHEEVLLRLLRGEGEHFHAWLRFGGVECCESYDIDTARLKRMPTEQALGILRERIPAEHRDFLERMSDTFRIGDYVFVHAGIRPGVALEQQDQSDLRWIREPFLTSELDHGHIVVHGHTVSEGVDIQHNRIGLDTGAYRTHVLSALGLEGQDRWFLRTSVGTEFQGDQLGIVAS